MKIKNKNIISTNITPLVLILVSIIFVYIISRLITYSILIAGTLPGQLLMRTGDFRLHHFVYGNILITVTSFLAIGLGIRKHRNLFAVSYGIGLGLVLDEFLLWMGDVNQLTSNVMWIPHSFTIIATVSLVIASIIMVELYELHKFSFKLKLK